MYIRYTSNKKLSEQKQGRIDKKTMALLFAGAISVVGYFGGYDKIKEEYTHGDEVRNQIQEKIDIPSTTEREFSKFLNENKDKFEDAKKILTRYYQLYNKENRNSKDEKELDFLVETINMDYGKEIRTLALNAVKSKIADANKISDYKSLRVEPCGLEKGLEDTIVNIVTIPGHEILYRMEKDEEKSELSRTLFLLMKDQYTEPERDWDKTRIANELYKLYNLTVKVSNNMYVNKKDENIKGINKNKLVEIRTSKEKDIEQDER